MRNRDPKTGRFISKAKAEVKAKKSKKKEVKAVAKKQEVKFLVNPLQVYGKKDLSGKPSHMRPEVNVVIKPIEGTEAIRVKKENSPRTFYTTQKALEAAV